MVNKAHALIFPNGKARILKMSEINENKSKFRIFNATEIWQIETDYPPVLTFSQSLDKVLGKGIQLGALTEIIGLPGTGKTQLCLQLCASVQIPKDLSGLDGEALYIDTKANFTISRFKEILLASLTHCQRILGTSLDLKLETALEKLHYVNAFGLDKFCAFLFTLPSYIVEHPKIKLIVIDSIAFPFKGDDISVNQRTGLLFRLMADLHSLAIDKRIAVVLTNEMSTRLGLTSGSIVGALGDAWSHRCNKRLLLSQEKGQDANRFAVLLKSNEVSNSVGRFKITCAGIRDVD